MDTDVQTADRLDEVDEELTPDDYARLGRAMARVLIAAWRVTSDGAAPADDGA